MQEKDFVSYEYKTLSVKAKDRARMIDLYEAFGWEVSGTSVSATGGVTLSLKRDRHQRHKQELNRLERQAEETIEAINGLERSKTTGACVLAYLLGIAAALLLGGGMCLVMLLEHSIPAMAGGIVLGVIGLALCGVNYAVYQKFVAKKTKEVLPVIDQTEEKLANLLEKGNDLLKAELI